MKLCFMFDSTARNLLCLELFAGISTGVHRHSGQITFMRGFALFMIIRSLISPFSSLILLFIDQKRVIACDFTSFNGGQIIYTQ